jgi:glycosyltransferase involved in cell wall biosynthesis
MDEALVRNFQPVGHFDFPSRNGIRMAFPPFLDVIEYFEDQQFSEVIVSTPGPLGLTAIAAARMLGLSVTGIYHTDFPHYAYQMSEDDSVAEITQKYISWFFGLMDRAMVPSRWYQRELEENGCPADRISLLPWGVDSDFFRPERRREDFWHRYPCGDGFKFITVGHISRHKNVEGLIRAFHHVREQGCEADLVIVGDGPLLPELRRRYANQTGLVFTGALEEEDLAAAYAGADVFVHPSTAATFGNVVLEAQACGLPVIVADRGGPQDIVEPARSGLIVDVEADGKLAGAMECLYRDAELRRKFADRGRRDAEQRSWDKVLETLFQSSADPPAAAADSATPRHQATAPEPVSVSQAPCPYSP